MTGSLVVKPRFQTDENLRNTFQTNQSLESTELLDL